MYAKSLFQLISLNIIQSTVNLTLRLCTHKDLLLVCGILLTFFQLSFFSFCHALHVSWMDGSKKIRVSSDKLQGAVLTIDNTLIVLRYCLHNLNLRLWLETVGLASDTITSRYSVKNNLFVNTKAVYRVETVKGEKTQAKNGVRWSLENIS